MKIELSIEDVVQINNTLLFANDYLRDLISDELDRMDGIPSDVALAGFRADIESNSELADRIMAMAAQESGQ